jgi:hypothetical protein
MKIFKNYCLIIFCLLLITGCLSIPKNTDSGKTCTMVKIAGVIKSQISLSNVRYGTYQILPVTKSVKTFKWEKYELVDSNTVIREESFLISSLQSPYSYNLKLKPGNYNEWLFVEEYGASANMKAGYYIEKRLKTNVTIKENCLTILPFKVWYELGSITEGNDSFVDMTVTIVELTDGDISGIIDDLKKDKNVFTYKAVYYGDKDITSKVKSN